MIPQSNPFYPVLIGPHFIGPPLRPWLHSSHWSPISLVSQCDPGYTVLIGPPSHWSPSLTLVIQFSLVPHLIGPPMQPCLYSSHWFTISLVPHSNTSYPVLIGPPSQWSPKLWNDIANSDPATANYHFTEVIDYLKNRKPRILMMTSCMYDFYGFKSNVFYCIAWKKFSCLEWFAISLWFYVCMHVCLSLCIYIYIYQMESVDLTTKSAQHTHARMSAIIVVQMTWVWTFFNNNMHIHIQYIHMLIHIQVYMYIHIYIHA